jgi:hypothetical protein
MFQTVRAFAMLRAYTAEEMAERSANGITAGSVGFCARVLPDLSETRRASARV